MALLQTTLDAVKVGLVKAIAVRRYYSLLKNSVIIAGPA
jgi:hypothetical protein